MEFWSPKLFDYFSCLLTVLDVSSFYFFLLFLFITEEVSARIVQVVTAEAVAVLKGEQEKESQHKDQLAALPIGKCERTSGQGLYLLHPNRRNRSSSKTDRIRISSLHAASIRALCWDALELTSTSSVGSSVVFG